jgi:hypothetical protein
MQGTPKSRRSKIERIDRVLDALTARVRLRDGSSLRMNTIDAQTLIDNTEAVIEYDVDAYGNRYNPRPTPDTARQLTLARTQEAARALGGK